MVANFLSQLTKIALSIYLCSMHISANNDDGNEPPSKSSGQKYRLTASDAETSSTQTYKIIASGMPYNEPVSFARKQKIPKNIYYEFFNEMDRIAAYYQPIRIVVELQKILMNRLGVFCLDYPNYKTHFETVYVSWIHEPEQLGRFVIWEPEKDKFLKLTRKEKIKLFPLKKRDFMVSSYKAALTNINSPLLTMRRPPRPGFTTQDTNIANPYSFPSSGHSTEHFVDFVFSHLKDSQDKSVEHENPTTPVHSDEGVFAGAFAETAANCDEASPEHVFRNTTPKIPLVRPSRDIGFTAEDLAEYLKAHVVGQDDAMNTLAFDIHRHYLSIHLNAWYELNKIIHRDEPILQTYAPNKKSNILIIGPTGSGKTLSMDLIESYFKDKRLKIPVVKTSAASLTRTGYVGPSVHSVFKTLLKKEPEITYAEQSIVFIDEIDKIAKVPEASGRDIGGESVQNELLDIFQGTEQIIKMGEGTSEKRIALHTKNILFICGGAFKGMKSTESDFMSDTKLEDFGFGKEFVGRLHRRIMYNPISKTSLRLILEHPYESKIKQLQSIFKLGYDIDVVFTQESLDAIVSRAILNPTGTRSLQAMVDRIFLKKIPLPSQFEGQTIEITAKDVLSMIAEPELNEKDKKEKEEAERFKRIQDTLYG